MLRVSWVHDTSAHSQNQVSAYFTSVQILSIERTVTNKKEAVTSTKGSMYLIYKWANTDFWQRYGRKSQLKSSKRLVYQGADNAFCLCTGRTDVEQKFATDNNPESQPKNLETLSPS